MADLTDNSHKTIFIQIYQQQLNHLSAVRHGECSSYPSCSEYAAECVRKHGPILVWIMTCDRLMRCGRDEANQSPTILVNGQKKVYDPVSENDKWWYSGNSLKQDSYNFP